MTTFTPEQIEAAARIKAWLDRGNPPGGMNLRGFDNATPSIREDLRTLLASLPADSPELISARERLEAAAVKWEPTSYGDPNWQRRLDDLNMAAREFARAYAGKRT